MEVSKAPTPRAAALFGAMFALVFLSMNDPDAMPPAALALSKWVVVLPAACLFAARPAANAWATGFAMAGGIFAGTCVVAIGRDSNIWPIAGAYWMIVWSVPVALGSAAGALVAWCSLDTGWLPCGPNGLKGRVELHRERQPLGYWLMFTAYSAGGLWCLFTAFGILSGSAEPLPLQ